MADDDPLLSYSIRTVPNPLQAKKTGRLEIVVSNPAPTKAVLLESIEISVIIGSGASDLTKSLDGISLPDPAGWTVRATATSKITAKPNTPLSIQGAGVVIIIDTIAINDVVGTTTISIDEMASSTGHSKKYRSRDIDVAKFPTTFELSDLTGDPVTIESGGSTALMWSGTNLPGLVSYKLKYVTNGRPVELDVDHIGPRTVSDLTTEPQTVFTLLASLASGPPVTRQFAINVTPKPIQPVLDEVTATFSGEKLTIKWRASVADYCLINTSSARQETSGSYGPFTPDRLCYTVTAVKGTRTTKRELQLFTDSVAQVNSSVPDPIAVAPDGSLVVVGSLPSCQAYDGPTLKLKRELGSLPAYVVRPAFSPDGATLFLGGHNAQTGFGNLYKVSDLSPAGNKNLGFVEAATYSVDGRSIFVAVTKSTPAILRVDARTLETQKTYTYAGGENTALCCSPDGTTLYFLESGTLVAVDIGSGTRGKTVAVGGGSANALAYWDGGEKKYLIAGDGIQIKIIDPATFAVVQTLGYFATFGVTAGELLCWNLMDTHLLVFDLQSLSLKQSLDVPGAQQLMQVWARFAAGSVYTYVLSMPGVLRRHAVTRAVAGPPQTSALVRGEHGGYRTLKGGSTLVLVSSNPSDDLISVDVAIDAADADAPAGWSAIRSSDGFTFTRLGRSADILTFTFREAKGEPRVIERSAAGTHEVAVAP